MRRRVIKKEVSQLYFFFSKNEIPLGDKMPLIRTEMVFEGGHIAGPRWAPTPCSPLLHLHCHFRRRASAAPRSAASAPFFQTPAPSHNFRKFRGIRISSSSRPLIIK